MKNNKNKKLTLIILDENETKTLNISRSLFNFIQPFIFFGFFSVVGLSLLIFFSLSVFILHYSYLKKNYYNYTNAKHTLIKSYFRKEKELEFTKQELLKLLKQKEAITNSKLDLQRLKNYLRERGVHIKPTYKGDLGKISSNRQNVGGPLNLNKSHIDINKNIKDVSVNMLEIKSMYEASRKIPMGYPYIGLITSLFGYRRNPISNSGKEFHRGLDIKGPYGDDVRSTADGIVYFAGKGGGYGNIIKIKNGFGYSTFYGHLSKIFVKTGAVVKAGDVIGKIGSTGRSTGSHLHYEVRKNDEPINPELFLTISD